ncbi:MAG: hypothetical protein MR967_04445 [Holdemanella sp.]|uniref:hypothetical protein n=1 Tax=Holdemanella sp. TaxID=1971762 RepID=UPI0025872574|nr:hypothetical protein [Holdemanella sp.]MCI7166177.1 hypothetical protein [Holdemanella sp.]
MNRDKELWAIAKANEIIKTTNIKGKDYAEVNQRIKAFRLVHPSGCITTEIVELKDGIVTMKASVFDEAMRLLGTGYAQEKEQSSYINKTSYIENCETSAIGRALGMCGYGVDVSVASAEEVQNAINNQQIDEKKLGQLSKTYTELRTQLTNLGCDFRSDETNAWICEKAKITTQNLQALNSEELARLCKVYEGMINAKVKKV